MPPPLFFNNAEVDIFSSYFRLITMGENIVIILMEILLAFFCYKYITITTSKSIVCFRAAMIFLLISRVAINILGYNDNAFLMLYNEKLSPKKKLLCQILNNMGFIEINRLII